MSMENALLAHAAAINSLATAISSPTGLGNLAAVLAQMINNRVALAAGMQELDAVQVTAAQAPTAAADPNPQAIAKGDAEVEQAVAKVEEAAKVEQAAPAETPAPADTPAEAAPDYTKDVRPVLLAAVKKVGKAEVEKLIASFGADKGDKVPADKLGELLAGAKKLAA